jgi:hypothetical protein
LSNKTSPVDAQSTCVLNFEIYADAKDELDYLEKKMDALSPSWAIGSITGDRKNQIDSAIGHYNRMGIDWADRASQATEFLESLSGKHFPEALISELEALSCVTPSMYEKVNVRSCSSSITFYLCDLELTLPTATMMIRAFHKISYMGGQIKDPSPTSTWVGKIGTEKLYELECEDAMEQLTAPLCLVNELTTECSMALVSGNIDNALGSCRFTIHSPEPAHDLLTDGGVLINDPRYTIVEGGKIVYAEIPLVIYTSDTIVLTLNEEFTYVPQSAQAKSQVVHSRLSGIQKTLVVTKAFFHDLVDTFNFFKYADATLLALQAIFGPMAVAAMAIACKNRRGKGKKEKKLDAKRKRKGNEKANRRLLRTIEL